MWKVSPTQTISCIWKYIDCALWRIPIRLKPVKNVLSYPSFAFHKLITIMSRQNIRTCISVCQPNILTVTLLSNLLFFHSEVQADFRILQGIPAVLSKMINSLISPIYFIRNDSQWRRYKINDYNFTFDSHLYYYHLHSINNSTHINIFYKCQYVCLWNYLYLTIQTTLYGQKYMDCILGTVPNIQSIYFWSAECTFGVLLMKGNDNAPP